MTIEQLLIPRYEVLSDYPHSPFKKDQIIVFNAYNIRTVKRKKVKVYSTAEELFDIYVSMEEEYFDKYPSIFRKVFWFEYRKELDLPEYIELNGIIHHVRSWMYHHFPKTLTPDTLQRIEHWEVSLMKPATEKEFINSQKRIHEKTDQ